MEKYGASTKKISKYIEKCEPFVKPFMLVSAVLLFWVATNVMSAITTGFSGEPPIIPGESILLLTAVFLGASCIFLLNQRVNYMAFAFVLTALAAMLMIRGNLLYFVSGDYSAFLAHWVEEMRGLTIRQAMVRKIGDYNMPYLYVLMLISRIGLNDLYLIKLFSIIFDVILAYFVMKIVSIKFSGIHVQIMAFIAVLATPTVIMNGALWGQCDAIFAALAIASLYCGFTGKSVKCCVFFGLAFAFKLQAVFIAPILAVFVFTKKIKLLDMWTSAATVIAALVPAILGGRSVYDTISIYGDQINSYPKMTLNTPSIYMLMETVNGATDDISESALRNRAVFQNFNTVAILTTALAVAALLYFLYVNRRKITSAADYVSISFTFALMIPMLLPRMHERYLFLADALSITLIFFNRKRWYFAPVIILASVMTYSHFLFGWSYFVPIKYTSLIMIFITLLALKDLVTRFYSFESGSRRILKRKIIK
ncbi:MAG: glycosyltransferase 87 family protein [Oscillospiraceae bacterium]|jgi:Gpi18-like mannosyltransferase|nr:glycosyltransferase 87 family protein [Oscillospiraceae bacterium]